MKTMFTAITSLAFLMCLGAGFIACDEAIPNQYVQLARQSITQAEGANADYYAATDLSRAKDNYSEALRFIVDGDNAQAREMAMISLQAADVATVTARKLYAEEVLSKAEKAIANADAARAGYLAPGDMAMADQYLTEAKAKYDEGDMITAARLAEDAAEAAERARSGSVARFYELEKAISDAENAVKRAESNEAVATFAQSELNAAKKHLENARTERKKLDSPTIGTVDGGLVAAEAYSLAMQYSGDAVNGVDEAMRLGMEREREYYRKRAESTMDEAKKLLDEIQKLKEQGLIKQLQTAVDDKPLTNLEKYEAALEALKKAESEYSKEEYKATVAEAEEAIRLAKLVQTSSGTTVAPPEPKQEGDKKYYTVRLIPEARDCLWRIASYPFIYGDASLWPKIWEANKGLIPNPDLIEPGQVFEIPPQTDR
ncbi:MAG: DUF4398 domain-containing protein [Spirochaetota bacterium]|jgi:nucleoid-associated protein YgaU|nr:DUF4398 domain-containing protein [Spirochaetota bacterium]